MKRWFVIVLILIICTSVSSRAEDTEIYGTVTNPDLEPNILIVFDSSGSMSTVDVPGDPYDPGTAYTGSYSINAVYERYWSWATWSYQWRIFADDVNDLNCTWIKDDLLAQGYAYGRIYAASYACGGSRRRLRIGNFMNYDESGVGTLKSRIEVAQQVVTDLIYNTTGVRFGLMRFNPDQGGRLVAACGTDASALITEVASITADGWTPLAETLAEAGLYFAGMDSWYNSGTYTSPMQERCQKNYIILMTDGQPTQDIDYRLTDADYINGDKIGDYDNDHSGDEYDYSDDGSDYLDDVAKYLYENDCNPTLGDGTTFDKQNIVTYTIGFKTSHQLLQDTASNGGGEYYTADNISELALAFDEILTAISEENAVFVAPVVPISRMNRTYAGDKIYLGFFKPQQSGRWIGNIKRYALDDDGILYDATGAEACTPDGLIKDNALSFWTILGNDGPDVEKGGAAEMLELLIDSPVPRNLFTYTLSDADAAELLTDPSNAFIDSNDLITDEDLGVVSSAERAQLFNAVHGAGLGDIIHSEPAVVHYPDPDGNPVTDDAKTVIYAGSNDGILHAFDDGDGSEIWGFIAPHQLGRLKLLDNDDHDYFMDGSPSVYHGGGQKILIMGERRGGQNYVALDITAHDAPVWQYSIGPTILDPDPLNFPDTDSYELLGQSWSRPQAATVATNAAINETGTPPDCSVSVSTDVADIFLIPGGYDNNQDLDAPSAADSVGRAIFGIRVAYGEVVSGLNFNAIANPTLGMTHSIVDVSGIDHDGDGIVNRIYAGDLGGNIFAFKDDEDMSFCGGTYSMSVADGSWSAQKLFSASAADGVQRKIFYAPDVVGEEFGEYIFFGTGDRTNPGDTGLVDRFYAVKNDWSGAGMLDETDLVDVTDNLIQLGTEAQKQTIKTSLENGKGWFIRLENTGEKVVASPRVYGGVVYFTTYTPDTGGTDDSDPCAASTVRGVGRLYAVDYQSGASVSDFSAGIEYDGDGNVVDLGKNDRAIAIGTAIPSAPVIAIFENGARIFIGVEGGIVSMPAIVTPDMYRYYWHQMF
jgi:type IV pilus assembly protein PilY1